MDNTTPSEHTTDALGKKLIDRADLIKALESLGADMTIPTEHLSDGHLAGMLLAFAETAAAEHRQRTTGLRNHDDVQGYSILLLTLCKDWDSALTHDFVSHVNLYGIARHHAFVDQHMAPATTVGETHRVGASLINLIGLLLTGAGMASETLIHQKRDERLEWLTNVAATAEAAAHSANAMKALLSISQEVEDEPSDHAEAPAGN
jgi:hypothetical protein